MFTRPHLAALFSSRADALRAWVRPAFAFALAVAALASVRAPAATREDAPAPAPYGTECHCALQAQSTAIVLRGAVDSWKGLLLDFDAEPASRTSRAQPSAARFSRRAGATVELTAPRARGYDATAPPALALA